MFSLERGRAQILLLGIHTPAPAPRRGFLRRLTDPATCRALGYAVLLGPIRLVSGGLTLLDWTTAAGRSATPVNAGNLHDRALHVAGVTVTAMTASIASVLAGLLLLTAMPSLTRQLARIDGTFIRIPLHQHQ